MTQIDVAQGMPCRMSLCGRPYPHVLRGHNVECQSCTARTASTTPSARPKERLRLRKLRKKRGGVVRAKRSNGRAYGRLCWKKRRRLCARGTAHRLTGRGCICISYQRLSRQCEIGCRCLRRRKKSLRRRRKTGLRRRARALSQYTDTVHVPWESPEDPVADLLFGRRWLRTNNGVFKHIVHPDTLFRLVNAICPAISLSPPIRDLPTVRVSRCWRTIGVGDRHVDDNIIRINDERALSASALHREVRLLAGHHRHTPQSATAVRDLTREACPSWSSGQ